MQLGQFILFCRDFRDFENLLDHLRLLAWTTAFHGRSKTTVKVVFHEHLVGGAQEANYRQILLHNIYAVFAFRRHPEQFVHMAFGLLKIEQDLGVMGFHDFNIIRPIP